MYSPTALSSKYSMEHCVDVQKKKNQEPEPRDSWELYTRFLNFCTRMICMATYLPVGDKRSWGHGTFTLAYPLFEPPARITHNTIHGSGLSGKPCPPCNYWYDILPWNATWFHHKSHEQLSGIILFCTRLEPGSKGNLWICAHIQASFHTLHQCEITSFKTHWENLYGCHSHQ